MLYLQCPNPNVLIFGILIPGSTKYNVINKASLWQSPKKVSMSLNSILYSSSFKTKCLTILFRLLYIYIKIIQLWNSTGVNVCFFNWFLSFAFMDVVILLSIILVYFPVLDADIILWENADFFFGIQYFHTYKYIYNIFMGFVHIVQYFFNQILSSKATIHLFSICLLVFLSVSFANLVAFDFIKFLTCLNSLPTGQENW